MDVATMGRTALAEAYEAKIKRLNELFEKGGEDYDLTEGEVKEIRNLNCELTEIADALKKYTDLDAIKAQDHGVTPLVKDDKDLHPKAGEAEGKKGDDEQWEYKSLGQLFIESQAYKGYSPMRRHGPEVTIDYKDIMGLLGPSPMETKATFTTANWPSRDLRLPGFLEYPRIRPVVADLIPQSGIAQSSLSYVAELVGNNAADFVDEGDIKPESSLDFEERTAAVYKIATWIPVTDEIMEDEPALRGIIDARLRLFIQLAEEDHLLNHDGSSGFTGLYNVVGVQNQAVGTDPVPDAFYKGMTLISVNAKVQPTGIVMHPNDWQGIRLMRTNEGIYIWGHPSEEGVERLWGLPVVQTESATEGTAIVGAFNVGCQIFRRTGITFGVSDSHSDFFVRNQLAIRAEERLAFVVFRPAAFCTISNIAFS